MLTPILFTCVLALGQPRPAEPADWLLIPLLARGQELVYRGSFSEESLDSGVLFNRGYRVELRVFALDLVGREAQVACLTQLKQKPARPEAADTGPCSVRLEVFKVGAYGKVTSGAALGVPVEGPPTLEYGMFVEVPPQRVTTGQTWEVAEEGRTPRTWRVEGSETISGTTCVKLVGLQQSEDWDRPRADSTAWRRHEVVWLAPRLGLVQRVERTIERSVLRYDLESNLQFPGQLWEDRRREVLLAQGLGESLTTLLPQAGQVGPKPFEAILAKISTHMDMQPPTPFRAALQQLRTRAEAGRRGESPPEVLPVATTQVIPVITLNRPAPDFVSQDLVSKETCRLRRWLGKPILLVFYQPNALTTDNVLGFAQAVQDGFKGQVTVLGMACTDDPAAAVRLRHEKRLNFPLLAGNGLPKMVILDGDGLVRGSAEGWGSETAQEVWQELLRCLKPVPRGPME
jgi:hypothetical protein